MVSSSSPTVFDSVQSLLDSIILENPNVHEAENSASGPFIPTSSRKTTKPTVIRYYFDDSKVLYPAEVNGGTFGAKACMLFKYKNQMVKVLWKVASVGVSAVSPGGGRGHDQAGESEGVLEPVDQNSVPSGEGVTGLPGYPNPITKDDFERTLAAIPCLSLSARIGMLGAAVGAEFGRGGGYEKEVWDELHEVLANIDSVGVGDDEAPAEEVGGDDRDYGAEDPVLVNLFNSLDGEGKGYIETVEGGDGGEQAISHCGTQFNAD